MRASEILTQFFHEKFTKNDWPNGVLENLDSKILTDGLFPLRDLSGVPMWPSSLYGAHIRKDGDSRHSIHNGERLADATDMHVSSISRMITVMDCAEQIRYIGGIGIYFDTNTPMVHIDGRPNRLVWLRTHLGEYVYRERDPVRFYLVLAEQIKIAESK